MSIDIEAEVFEKVASTLEEAYPGVFVSNEYEAVPPTFPAVSMIQIDGFDYERSFDLKVNHSVAVFEANIYTNTRGSKKVDAKTIAETISDKMHDLGFYTTFLGPVDNSADPTICRIVGRFRGVVGVDGRVYRR